MQRYSIGYFRIPIIIPNANKEQREGKIYHFLSPSPCQDFEGKKMRRDIASESWDSYKTSLLKASKPQMELQTPDGRS